MSGYLLCTDLDRTLIPNGDAEESPGARELFRRLVSHADIELVYVTGRDPCRVRAAIAQYALPPPDYVLADVGSSLYRLQRGRWLRDSEWDAKMAGGWPTGRIKAICDAVAKIGTLRCQEASKQGPYKRSFYYDLNEDSRRLEAALQSLLRAQQVDANLIFSIDDAARVGLIDILPMQAGKCAAIEYLRHQRALDYSRLVFAGDSGNDIDVLRSRVPAVLVANADEVLRRQLHAGDALYFARGGLCGMNGNYAAGIVEGAAHYWRWVREWLEECAEP